MKKKNNFLILIFILFSTLFCASGEFDGWGKLILHHVADSKSQTIYTIDAEKFEDINNDGKWNNEESFEDVNYGNNISREECNDKNGRFTAIDDLTTYRFKICGWKICKVENGYCGNGQWDEGEKFIDENNDEVWTAAEIFTDNNGNNIYDYKKEYGITKHVIMLLISAVVTILISVLATKKYRKNIKAKPQGLSQIFEILIDFIKKDIVIPNIGKKYSRTWTPVAMTFFVFILTCNLLGLIPFFVWIKWGEGGGSTATGNFSVTVALAIITFFAIIIAGIKKHGFIGHWKNMIPSGVPKPVLIILIPIEIIGMIVKPFALTMRLGANMTAGHIGMVAIFALPIILGNGIQEGQNLNSLIVQGLPHEPLSYVTGFFAGFVAVLLNTGIYGLELIVSLVQAYVFTLLSCVFIGMAIHADH